MSRWPWTSSSDLDLDRYRGRVAPDRIALVRRMLELLRRMREAGWAAPTPASEQALLAAERELGVALPDDHRAFLLATGGSAASAPWRGLWRLEEIVSLNRSLPLFRWFGGLVGIGNEGFAVYALDYRRFPAPPVVTVGLSASDWEDVTDLAPTFEAWLASTLPGG